jgi:hypothetical protein
MSLPWISRAGSLPADDERIRAVSTQSRKLTKHEIQSAFSQGPGADVPVIVSPAQLGGLAGVPTKTVYEWLAKGRLDGAFRRRGKHVLIWRDRAIDILFNGRDWANA